MKNTFAYFALGLALSVSGIPASAQIGNAGNSPSTPAQNVFCEKNLRSTVTRVSKTVLPSGYSDLKDVQLNSDFRFPKNDLPFSQALSLNDPVTGQSVGVLDQNFIPGGSKVSSAWGRYGISIGGYWVYISSGGFGSAVISNIIPFEADILWIPDGESFLIIKGCNGRFTVTNEVAAALRNFPAGKNGYIRFSTEGTGSAVLSEIGKETVQAWKKVYANWAPEAPPKVESLGF
ncbi:hypothetical protein KBZ15_07960 [Cyanobium sp. BA20m-p-22]|uniref:hypothetical protein n=1 Tax=Cyanobium sp. BA20m-p-22 TaxID=2823704 RepID=UPI0020CD708D|nr:hypothetical protein [Cyanobium sp. BA20m-p-22]MCP9909840.1 hypothetical protein [Cyanobium sp. BA20m-p-22]